MEDIVFFDNKDKAFEWFESFHNKHKEIWIGYYKKNTGIDTISWSESVDVALCYGWIDGIRKTIDENTYKIRFTPRKLNSVWSKVNVEKVKKLTKDGKMKPEGLNVFNNRNDKEGYSSEKRNIPLSLDFENEIKKNDIAWEFFCNLAPSYKRDTVWWVMSAKKEETRLKRLKVLIESSEKGKKIPFLGG